MPQYASTGYLLRHEVPANNSCLFTSIHFCVTGGEVDENCSQAMRKTIAEKVAADPIQFDDAVLGQSNKQYCDWIQDTNNWGGAIELCILSKYYEKEIVVADIKSARLNRFGENYHYPERILLLYDGLHYDPLKFQPLDDSSPVQTIFPTEDEEILTMALELANEAKRAHQFTDVRGMTMRCAVCGVSLNSTTAPKHAGETGHVEFEEIA
ncbi:Ubiquitin thioesterase OTU1, partial [Fragariocoptes setiger]